MAQGLTHDVDFHTSVSHDGDYVIAMVVAEAKTYDKATGS